MYTPIGPLRCIVVRTRLNQALEDEGTNDRERLELLAKDTRVFLLWMDAIARANPNIVKLSYDDFVTFIREHWLDILTLGIKIAVLFVAPNPNHGER